MICLSFSICIFFKCCFLSFYYAAILFRGLLYIKIEEKTFPILPFKIFFNKKAN